MPVSAASARRRVVASLLASLIVVVSLSGCGVGPVLDRALDRIADGVSGSGTDGTAETFDDDDDTVSDDGNTQMMEIAVGDCLNDAVVPVDAAEIASLDVVDCNEPHDSEVYGFAPYEIDDYPAEDVLFDIAEEGCFAMFEPFVGQDYDVSALEFSYYTPTRESWKYGDRDAMCVIYSLDETQLTGSVEGSGL